MNLTRDRMHSLRWAMILLVSFAALVALVLRVNAVKSQLHDVDRSISGTRDSIAFLETEFQTRANQVSIKQLNDVELGYSAPDAAQYIEGERQLAALGRPAAPGAPPPIRYARDDGAVEQGEENPLMAMVSPVTGKAGEGAAEAKASPRETRLALADAQERSALARDAKNLASRLSDIKFAGAQVQ